MADNADDEGIVRAIVEMAHCLKLEVVAEGVENQLTLDRLIGFGCEFGQGYHWAQAMPAAEFESYFHVTRSCAS
jgi:EAL domain-containing protein (putative c-di-GMP-specific phosphodiesterase class I)